MRTPGVCTSVSALVALFFGLQASNQARAEPPPPALTHVLTGELVIINVTAKQFRLVGHRGSFAAPAETSLDALEGKPVQAEIKSDRHVVSIRPMSIHFEPVTHAFDLVSGVLVVRDPATRTFAIAGDDATYIAPSGVDVSGYAGRVVEICIDEGGRVVGIEG